LGEYTGMYLDATERMGGIEIKTFRKTILNCSMVSKKTTTGVLDVH